jgi:hypothetical protein
MNFLLSDLPLDLIHDKIGAYLLEDPNKTIHKIFKNRKDDDLQILLFGEVKDLTYINMCNGRTPIDYPMNNKLKNYVNRILKAKGSIKTCEKMKVNFYKDLNYFFPVDKLNIIFLNKEDKYVASIDKKVYYRYPLGFFYEYILSYRHNNEWIEQEIDQKKKSIIKEYEKIHYEIKEKYF